ncbi:putative pre-mRNA-splicing factor ATP-dependent RNA helicase DHX16 [Maniola jurtina]|uniref:putative pre-mRNA-splicing factor ATP-dependent RNA helicase DHX16 n=1 Tax=Maniola jurtina TaxID=191418 RepID=UPI001E68E33A|nr:putative pre-mRNA-splicing factor ATP-dependent RNA helicase DHX16 [Maniola jurtina]
MESSCTRFTAAEGGARLAACAGSKNILVTEHTAFISTSVLIEHAYKIRGRLSSGSQRSVYITRPSRIECVSHELTILTDLSVIKAHGFDDVTDWRQELEVKEVLVCTSEVLQRILKEQIVKIPNINVLIIDSSHLIFKDENLQYIMKLYKQCDGIKPRILALTYPLFTAPKDINEQIDKNIDNDKDPDKMNEENDENGVEKEIKDEVSELNDSKDDIDEVIDVKDNSYDEDNDSKDTDSEKQQTKDSADREDSKDNKIKFQKQFIKDIRETLSEDDNKTIDKITEIQDTEDKSYVEKNTDCKQISKDIENPATINQNYEEINEKDNKDTESKNTDEKIDENTEKVIDSSIDIDESIDKDDNVIDDIKIEIDNMDDFNLYEKLEWKIEELEKELCCDMDLAEDIDGGKRSICSG